MTLNDKAKGEINTILLDAERKQHKSEHLYQEWSCLIIGIMCFAIFAVAAVVSILCALMMR